MAEQRLIYRIENEAGRGPFWDGDVRVALPTDYDVPEYPTPAEDPGIGNDVTRSLIRSGKMDPENLWNVGCASTDQLRYWFDAEDCTILTDLGYGLTLWRCPSDRAVVGEYQVIFDRALAECIQRDPACQLWADERLAA